MPAAWFLVPMVDAPGPVSGATFRRPAAIINHLPQVRADGGRAEWAETGGNRVVAKVQASTQTLEAIAAEAGVNRIPVLLLDTELSALTNTQRRTLRDWARDCGFTAAELGAALPADLAGVTLRDYLELLGTKGHGRVSRIFGRVGDTTPRTPKAR